MKTMPKSTKEKKFRWIKPILDREISIKNMAKVCPFSERSIKYWLGNYRKYGLDGLENKLTRPKTNPKETPSRIKEAIIALRNKTKLSVHVQGLSLDDSGARPCLVANKKQFQALVTRISKDKFSASQFDFTALFLASRAVRRGEQTFVFPNKKSRSPIW